MGVASTQLDGTCVEISGLGVLLRGPSGSGKSSLALRLIDGGARLVADDRTEVLKDGGRLVASAPAAIAGRLEVRGIGIVEVPAVARVPLGLVVDLKEAGEEIERLPEPDFWEHSGVRLPRLDLAPFSADATAKLRLAVRLVRQGILPAP